MIFRELDFEDEIMNEGLSSLLASLLLQLK